MTNEVGCAKAHFGAIWQTLVVVGTLAALSLTLWLTIGFADVPLKAMNGIYDTSDAGRVRSGYFSEGFGDLLNINFQELNPPKNIVIRIKMSYISYLISFVSFMGSFLFLIFVGIGLAAMPIDNIKVYFNRPRQMSTHQLIAFKKKYSTAALHILVEMDDIYAKLASSKPKHQVI